MSNLPPSIDDAKLPEHNKTPAINTLTKMFFIDFSPWCAKITAFQFPLRVLYPIQSIDFNGNFRIWNRFFPKWEFGGGRSAVLFIRTLSGKNSRLTEVPFWNWTEEIFHFIAGTLIEDCFSHSECISCYRIAKIGCECAEICRRRTPSRDASEKRPRRGLCCPGFLVFVTFQPWTFQSLFFGLAVFYYGNGNARFPAPGNGAGIGRNPDPKSSP